MIDVGDEAPDFTLQDQSWQPVTLSSFRGDKHVVIVFYPWSFTRTCESEMCALRDEFDVFVNDDVVTLAISTDAPPVHRAWAKEQGFNFPMLADVWPHGAVARAYGVLNEDIGVAERGTFIVDKDGRVAYAVRSTIDSARDQAEYRRVLGELTSAAA